MASSLQVENWGIDKLIPYARNPRINDAAVPKLAGLIKEFGFKVPLIIKNDGSIIDGHERYKAAQLLGLKEVPCIVADDWTETQVKAFRLAVNKSAEWAQWDTDLLKLELADLAEMDFDLSSIDFSLPEIDLDSGLNESVRPAQGDTPTKEERREQDYEKYTQKIVTPIYEPTGKNVTIADCIDKAKYTELVNEINATIGISDEEKDFLISAASRHIKYDYQNIAEYYANASPQVQHLMRRSVLVILDIDQTIENGYNVFTESMQQLIEDTDNA